MKGCLQISVSFLCRSFDAYINCKIVATPAKYDFKPYAYGFQKDSPFLPLFNYYLNEMKEKGSLKQIQVKYEPPPQICPDYSGKSLGVGSVFAAFGVLFFGAGISVILFCFEKLTQAFGMKWSIFSSYGKVDHSDEFCENDAMALLASKNNEIAFLKRQNLIMQTLLKSPRDYAWRD